MSTSLPVVPSLSRLIRQLCLARVVGSKCGQQKYKIEFALPICQGQNLETKLDRFCQALLYVISSGVACSLNFTSGHLPPHPPQLLPLARNESHNLIVGILSVVLAALSCLLTIYPSSLVRSGHLIDFTKPPLLWYPLAPVWPLAGPFDSRSWLWFHP